ncbi:MAG: lipid kinase, partial [bacterium]|nr:lipid kinase [bacterium]
QKANESIAYMAKFSGATVEEFKAQLKTTAMFYTAAEAANFTKGETLKKTMDYVRTFCFAQGLYPQNAKSKDHVGIMFPDGTITGDKKNVKLRFDASYMQLAAEGKL